MLSDLLSQIFIKIIQYYIAGNCFPNNYSGFQFIINNCHLVINFKIYIRCYTLFGHYILILTIANCYKAYRLYGFAFNTCKSLENF